MNPMIFPKMLFSPHEGWDWLMQIHRPMGRIFFGYVVPMSLIPLAMAVYAWHAYGAGAFPEMTLRQAYLLAAVLYFAELLVVPLMGMIIQSIGSTTGSPTNYRDAFTLAAVVPTPLWLAPLLLFVPSPAVHVFGMLLGLVATWLLIFEGVHKIFGIESNARAAWLALVILVSVAVAWVAMMGLVLASLGMLVNLMMP